jgi:predicted RNA methylase
MNVSEQIVVILDAGLCDGNHFTLQGQLDRKEYTAVNKVLVAAGAKWNRQAKAHLFDCDAQDAISDIVLTGKVVDAKREFDFFETPDELAGDIIAMADIKPHHTVLEPNAGGGRISSRAAIVSPNVDVIELQEGLAIDLDVSNNYNYVHQGDFLEVNWDIKYDRIVMNPPFGKQADIKHVSKAIDMLKPDGRLVAIMSVGVTFRSNKLTEDFRHLVASHGGVFAVLPEGSFKASGTAVGTVVLTLDKNSQ